MPAHRTWTSTKSAASVLLKFSKSIDQDDASTDRYTSGGSRNCPRRSISVLWTMGCCGDGHERVTGRSSNILILHQDLENGQSPAEEEELFLVLIIQITHSAPGQQIGGFHRCRPWPQPWRSAGPMAHPATDRAVAWPRADGHECVRWIIRFLVVQQKCGRAHFHRTVHRRPSQLRP